MTPTNDTGSADPDRPEDVSKMAASIIIEQESGTDTHRMHPHNGYYAGDFSTPRTARRTAAGFLTAPPALYHPGSDNGWHH